MKSSWHSIDKTINMQNKKRKKEVTYIERHIRITAGLLGVILKYLKLATSSSGRPGGQDGQL